MRQEKPRPIVPTDADLEQMAEKVAENPGLLPYGHTLSAPAIRPEDVGKRKGRSISAMQKQTGQQMNQLQEQMALLMSQAEAIKKRVEVSNRIYEADIPFEPLIAHTYYLYRRLEDSTDMLSMIGPHQWGRSKRKPLDYVATVTLLPDHTWQIDHQAEPETTHDITEQQ